MEKIETLPEFYKKKFAGMSERTLSGLGHFNLFRFQPHTGINSKPIPYKKRDYFKVALMLGKGRIHLGGNITEVKKQALVFSNPQVRSKWEQTGRTQKGCFCVFDQDFLSIQRIGHYYPVFHTNGRHVFELNDEQAEKVKGIYERMFEEIESEYIHKYELLANLVMELVHFAMKLDMVNADPYPGSASQRITTLFLELLEKQFSTDLHHSLTIRSPADFAGQQSIHVNYLNRSVKEIMGKTTREIIIERILNESKLLLRQSDQSVSEIAHRLGFNQVNRFHNLFKKYMKTSPLKYRTGRR